MASLQHKLDRVRRPRVQITYDVETNGAMEKKELPFVVGVLADLSGQPSSPLRPLKERKAVIIDRDNFNEVMARATPRVATKVQNRLTDEDTKLAVELNFKTMDDFDPGQRRRAGPRPQEADGDADGVDPAPEQDGGQRQARPAAGRGAEQHRQGAGAGHVRWASASRMVPRRRPLERRRTHEHGNGTSAGRRAPPRRPSRPPTCCRR